MTARPRRLVLHDCVVDLDSGRAQVGAASHDLTSREVDLLCYLARRPNEVVSRDDIEQEVWQLSQAVISRAVPQAVRRLRSKIERNPKQPQNLRTVHGVGWQLMVRQVVGESREEAPLAGTPAESRTGAGSALPGYGNAYLERPAITSLLSQRFDEGARLVTLCGPGGTGKSRLAVEFAAARADGQSWSRYCDLQSVSDLDGLYVALASVFGLSLLPGQQRTQLARHLGTRGAGLLLIDNVERLVDVLDGEVETWLRGAPGIAVIATSREPLGAKSEFRVPVGAMAVPVEQDDWNTASECIAVQLFMERAREASPGFVPDGQNAAIVGLVRALDGLPLALELAAARTRLMTPQQILQRLEAQPELLGATGPSDPTRGLRNTLEWTWRMLATEEQEAIVRATAFSGAFTVDAALRVLFGDLVDNGLDILQSLVEKGIIRSSAHQGRTWLQLPTLFRQFVLQLEPSPVLIREGEVRHGIYYADRWPERQTQELSRYHAASLVERLRGDLPDLAAAAERAAIRGHAAVAVPCTRAALEGLKRSGSLREGLDLVHRTLALEGIGITALLALRNANADMTYLSGDPETSAQLARAVLQDARREGDPHHEGEAHRILTVATALARNPQFESDSGPVSPHHDSLRVYLGAMLSECRAGRFLKHRASIIEALRRPHLERGRDIEAAGWSMVGGYSPHLSDVHLALSHLSRLLPDERARSVSPVLGALHAASGLLQLFSGKTDAASDSLRLSHQIHAGATTPSFMPLTLTLRGWLEVQTGAIESARKTLIEVDAIGGDALAVIVEWLGLTRGEVELSLGRVDAATWHWHKVLDFEPEMPTYPKILAVSRLSQLAARVEESTDLAHRAIGMAKQLGGARFIVVPLTNLAEVDRRRGLLLNALQNAERAVELGREQAPGLELAAALQTLARVRGDAGLGADARESYIEARLVLDRLGLGTDAPLRLQLESLGERIQID